MQSDFDDLRFTEEDGVTELSYWVESYTESNSATVWVKVPSIPASSTKTIYMYYGNQDATSVENGDATFDFFEDFETGLTKWDTVLQSGGSFTQSTAYKKEGNYSGLIQAGIVQDYYSYAILKTPVSFGTNVRFYFWVYTYGKGFSALGVNNSKQPGGQTLWWSGFDVGGTWDTYTDVTSTYWDQDIYVWMYSGNRYYTNRPTYYDLFLARKVVSPEPAASVGSEEEFQSGKTVTIEGIENDNYTVPDDDALPDDTYYWRVRAVDGAGNASEWSDIWQFTVISQSFGYEWYALTKNIVD